MEEGIFPDVVLLEIFRYLSLEDLLKARFVCKHWRSFIEADALWNRYIQKWNLKELRFEIESSELEAPKSAFKTELSVWNSNACVQVARERWHPIFIDKLWEYEHLLRKAERLDKGTNSSTQMYLRLNPCYEFTTKGKDTEDKTMRTACQELWEHFGENDDGQMIQDFEGAMLYARYHSKHSFMTNILQLLEPEWVLDRMGWIEHDLDKDCNIYIKAAEDEDPDDYPEEDLPEWSKFFTNRLPENLWKDIRNIFAVKSDHFIEYFMSEGCINENYQYGRFMYISDTAAYKVVQYYDL